MSIHTYRMTDDEIVQELALYIMGGANIAKLQSNCIGLDRKTVHCCVDMIDLYGNQIHDYNNLPLEEYIHKIYLFIESIQYRSNIHDIINEAYNLFETMQVMDK